MNQFHAYIRQAPEKRYEELALLFAEDVMQPDEAAKKRLYSHNHPDFLRIFPNDSAIKIFQIRDCLQELSVRPYEGGRRAVVFFHADKMTIQAQNCLLKTLEEPPFGTSFLLLCQRASMLLPTIRSRCMMLPALSMESRGDSKAASDLLQSIDSHKNVLEVAATLPQERNELMQHCNTLLDGLDQLIHEAAMGKDSSLIRLGRCVQTVHRTQQMIEHNVNAALCAQWLCIQIKEDNHDNRCWSEV